MESQGEIIVGIVGQWASGKSTASRTLVEYLGGEGEVVFINDQILLIGQAVKYFLELEDSKVELSTEADGRQRLDSEQATVWLSPGVDLETADLRTVSFNTYEDVVLWEWLNRARLELGHQICERSAEGKPIVIEAGFGTNTEPIGENPFSHTISDLFKRLEEAGLESKRVKWIIIEADFEKRLERNQKRRIVVPKDLFEKYAADGGYLEQDEQIRLEEQGTIIKRVLNNHDDIERFRADVVATFEDIFRDELQVKTVDEERE
jgi:hypothetical protein